MNLTEEQRNDPDFIWHLGEMPDGSWTAWKHWRSKSHECDQCRDEVWRRVRAVKS